MPDTPTPRAVLARAFTNELKRMLGDDPLPDGKPPFVYVGPESDLVLAVERDYLAALAASAGLLTAEVVQGLRRTLLTADGQGVSVKTDAFALLYGAYTALAAECARLKGELFEASQGPELLESCRQEIAALRATVAEAWERAREQFISAEMGICKVAERTGHKNDERDLYTEARVIRAAIGVMRDALARTPTPEGQG